MALLKINAENYLVKNKDEHFGRHEKLPQRSVIKVGGEGAENRETMSKLCHLIRFLQGKGHEVLCVHGGGRALTGLAEEVGYESHFIAGRRVTDGRILDLAKMVFSGKIATDLSAWMVAEGIKAFAMSGVTGGSLLAKKRDLQKVEGSLVDYGFVGDIEGGDLKLLRLLLDQGYVALFSSLGVDHAGQVYNINADTVACYLAHALGAKDLYILTEKKGIYRDINDETSLIGRLTLGEIDEMINKGMIHGGMLPKLSAIKSFLLGDFPDDSAISAFKRPILSRSLKLLSWHDIEGATSQEAPFPGTLIEHDDI